MFSDVSAVPLSPMSLVMKTGESGFTAFRLLTKTCQWLWVQATARVVFKAGKPDFIIARQKLLT